MENWWSTGERNGEGLGEEKEKDWKRVGRGRGEEPRRDWRRIGGGFGPKPHINIYVDARFGPQEPVQGMMLTASGHKMPINIYVDAHFEYQKPAKT